MRRMLVLPLLAVSLGAQTTANPGGPTMHVTGPMEVAVQPEAPAPAGYGRFMLRKHYHGALEAEAQGEMLSGGDPKTGTAGYVALETVTGTLEGHKGSFQLMHWGTMAAGKLELRIAVVPGSGTGALEGLSGTLGIENAGGKHSYTLDYVLPPTP